MALISDHKKVNEEAIVQHNKLRALHHTAPLTIDWALAKSAQAYANKLATTNSFGHSDSRGQYGENLACASNSAPGFIYSGVTATQQWYDEIRDYNFNEEKQNIGKIGHFSQVVWKNTKTAGFGRAKTSGGKFIIVGQYKPAGNFIGTFKENVLSPSGAPSKLNTKPKDVHNPVLPVKSIPGPKAPLTDGNIKKTNKIQNKFVPKSPTDILIKSCTKTTRTGDKEHVQTIETYKTVSGKTYEISN